MIGVIQCRTSLFITLLLVLCGCDKEQATLKAIYQRAKGMQSSLGEYEQVPGQAAVSFLQKSFRDQSLNLNGILGALAVSQDREGLMLTDDAQSVAEVDDSAYNILNDSQAAKQKLKRDDHSGVDSSFFSKELGSQLLEEDFSNDKVQWNDSRQEFMASVTEKIPVRDQGQRGTCASFAGVGQLEAFLIKKYNLSGIDLSEQRFYFMSKPESWQDGGDKNKQGSDSGTGFAKSAGIEYKGATFPPGSPKDFNIPLETDCSYSGSLGNNDLQTPQAKGCESGVAKVTKSASWLNNYDQRLKSAQQIYDFISKNDLPVVIATRLSHNWEVNDGMVTLKGASGTPGDTSHAAGHAYLIVGARKIDESKYPGEGGMCFVIKNSWGRGWGVNGFSCVTLAWFNKWRFQSAFPVVIDVELDPKKFSEAKSYIDKKPNSISAPIIQEPNAAGVRRGTVTFLTDEGKRNYGVDDFVVGGLRSDQDEYSKVLYIKGDSIIVLRGVLKDGEKSTEDLTLLLKDSRIILPHAKGDVEVGSLDHDKKIVTLCAQAYGKVCELNYVEGENRLVVGLTQEEFEKEESMGPFDWKGFGLGQYRIEFSKPEGITTRVDVRFVNGDQTTNPLRFNIDPLKGDIQQAGKTIGSLTDGTLCSGSQSAVCRIVLTGEKFNVLHRAKD